MDKNKKALLGLLILLAFATLVVIGTYYYVTSTGENSPVTDLIFKYHFEFMLFLGLGGIAVGAFSYYLLGHEVVVQKEISRKNAGVLFELLDHSERIIVQKLVEQKGKARQYEFAYDSKLGKVKAHRAVKKLASKGVVTIEKLGKVNSVVLKPEILDALSE